MFSDDDEYWNETWKRKIKKKYYKLIPYDWRPNQIWYRFTCLVWKRYTTVRPKCLGHTFCDRDVLLFHCAFQILCDFIEKEKPYDHFDTENSHNKKEWIELKELYYWYKTMPKPECYLTNENYDLCNEKLIELVKLRKMLWT